MSYKGNKRGFIPTEQRFNPNPKLKSKTAQAAKHIRTDKTLTRTIELLSELEKASGKTWNARLRTITKAYARHIVTGEALGGLSIPRDVKDRVWLAVRQACEETGHQLPARKPPPRKKKR